MTYFTLSLESGFGSSMQPVPQRLAVPEWNPPATQPPHATSTQRSGHNLSTLLTCLGAQMKIWYSTEEEKNARRLKPPVVCCKLQSSAAVAVA